MNTRQRFDCDQRKWKMKTADMSSLVEIVLQPEYQRIIGLGSAAVPLIIESLRLELDHWFWALTSIVGRDHAEGAETMQEARDRWLAWYDSNTKGREPKKRSAVIYCPCGQPTEFERRTPGETVFSCPFCDQWVATTRTEYT